jgi:uncharacterized protein (UPF0297 family)
LSLVENQQGEHLKDKINELEQKYYQPINKVCHFCFQGLTMSYVQATP